MQRLPSRHTPPQELYAAARQLASVVVPNEYGVGPDQKLRIGSKIAAELVALVREHLGAVASLKQVDRSLEEAALTLGAPPWRVFLRITVPQIVPGIAAGCLFAFMVSFDDFPLSFWLSDAETMPLPIFLHDAMAKVFDPSIAAMSSLMILTGILAVIGLEKLVGLRKAMSV